MLQPNTHDRFAGNPAVLLTSPTVLLGQPLVQPGSVACRTRAAYVAALLAEAVSFQDENRSEGDEDDDLQALIDAIRWSVDNDQPLRAYVIANQLRELLATCGYCSEAELPTYGAGKVA